MFVMILLAQAATAPLPDIELHATVRARSMTIETQGDASLTVTTDPPAPNIVDVNAPRATGRRTINNPNIQVNAQARIGDPLEGIQQSELPE